MLSIDLLTPTPDSGLLLLATHSLKQKDERVRGDAQYDSCTQFRLMYYIEVARNPEKTLLTPVATR